MTGPTHLEIIPIGGLGEFGMNLMVYRWGDDCLVVDAGMMFPGAEHLGVDVVIPDMAFLEECGRIHAVVLTHGHEDHIGAVPFLLGRQHIPVYATPLTEGLVRRRLREHQLGADLRSLPMDGAPIDAGPFTLETIPVAHSIPHAVMLVLRTPVGVVVHTADFKLDPSPLDGVGTDVQQRLEALGREGVLVLLSDSTNAEQPGFTPSERRVLPALDEWVGRAQRRVFVTSFASNMHRVRQVAEVAHKHGRQLALVGSSMLSQVEVAERLGLIAFPAGSRIDADSVMDRRPERTLCLVTGSQGEPLSALARIAVDRHRDVAIEDGDLVLHSARVIPGNEKSINRLINHLLRHGAQVVTGADALIHVSGHPSQEELRLVLNLLRPRYLIPIHGEYRQLLAHARLAVDAGFEQGRVVLAESGDVIAVDRRTAGVVDRVHAGQVFIDASLEEVDFSVIRDRRRIAGDGVLVPVVALDRENGADTVEIVSRGFLSEEDEPAVIEDLKAVASRALAAASTEERLDEAALKARVQTELKRFLRREIQRRPMILPVIVEL